MCYASILGYVGAGGLGLILNEKISWREYASVGMMLPALFVTVFIIETISCAADPVLPGEPRHVAGLPSGCRFQCCGTGHSGDYVWSDGSLSV